MRISLFGIGYVGSVAAACLARDGHTVIAVDTNPEKVAALNHGAASMAEPGLAALIQAGVNTGRLRAVADAQAAVAETDLSIICVGTPTATDRSLDLSAVERVATAIGAALATKERFHVVVVRSTLPPGAMTQRIKPAIERASGRLAGAGFGLAYHPEFLREGAAIEDYDDPSQSVLAVSDDVTLARVEALQPRASAPVIVSFDEAAATKMVSNIWRALKVGFANEVGGVLAAHGVDGHRVMEAVCLDTRFNMSTAYMTPGFAFGGSCLPKDLRAFIALGDAAGRGTPILEATLRSNRALVDHAVSRVRAAAGTRVALIGLAFKPGTDDLRKSPQVDLAARLIAMGCEVHVFDPHVRSDRLTGANLDYAQTHLPDLSLRLYDTLEAAVRPADILVLAHRDSGAAALDLAAPDQRILDLVRVRPYLRTGANYEGLSW